jgi:hypothetical protein
VEGMRRTKAGLRKHGFPAENLLGDLPSSSVGPYLCAVLLGRLDKWTNWLAT